MTDLNDTHDPAMRSWVSSANDADTDFPLQNLPHGVFGGQGGEARGGVAIGDQILDVAEALNQGLLKGAAAQAAAKPSLNGLLSLDPSSRSDLRRQLWDLLRSGGPGSGLANGDRQRLLVPMDAAPLLLPIEVGAFTDFLCSFYHAGSARVGREARPLDKAFKHLPIGYNSRASTVVASGRSLPRPRGQGLDPESDTPYFGPSRRMDFELELGAVFGGAGNPIGQPIPIGQVEDHLSAYVLLNDWSARDIQQWESRLGPFLAKSCMTSISPWLVTAEAMAPFRAPAFARAPGDPTPFPYLDDDANRRAGSLDLAMSAHLRTAAMRRDGLPPVSLCETNFKDAAYWNFAQMLAHHTSNGCAMRPGDILGSGTCSGEAQETAATYLEITGGTVRVQLPNGETRLWLEDGDEIILKGRASRDGFVSIGFGECAGELLPALG